MGIFDIFKKKKTDSTFPENELEHSLLQAPSSVSARKAFYQKLLWNDLVVLTASPTATDKRVEILKKETTVRFITFKEGQIPVFTSINRIFDQGVIKEEIPYITMKGQDLFGVAKGETFILNPYSEFAKELTPEEIGNLLNGTIYDKIDKQELENKKYQDFNMFFEQAVKTQEGLILLDGYHRKKVTESEKSRLEESILKFQKCLEIVPEHWQSMMLMSKALQRLGRHSEALEHLENASEIELQNHSITMEASTEAMHLNDLDKALYYSEESLKRKPNDFALMGNHAMNLLIAKKDEEAEITIDNAIKIQPKDSVNRNIKLMIRDVISGKRERPTFEDTIK